MTPASNSKFTAARVGAILFSVSLMGGFVWYSHIRAQPQDGVAVGEGTAQATILPGSKRSNVTVTPDNLALLPEYGTIDLNLQADASGKSKEDAKSEKPMILPSSKLGVFRNIASSPSTTPQASDGASAPKITPPPTERPVMLSGSKSFAGPVISGERLGNVIVIGQDKKTASQTQAAGPPPKPSQPEGVIKGGSKSLTIPAIGPEELNKVTGKEGQLPGKLPQTDAPAPEWNRDAPIFTSSKSGPIFPTVPQVPQRPVQAQAQAPVPAPNTPPAAMKAKEPAPQPQAEQPAPASP